MVPEGRLHPPLRHPPFPNKRVMYNGINFSVFPPSRVFIINNYLFSKYFFERFYIYQKKKEESILSKSENLETELKLLKSQINPHFLFNALNNIYALLAIDTTKTQKSISNLSNMLRYVLYECDQELVPLKKEILYIEDYIKLFSLKSSKKYPIEFKINAVDTEIMVAPMIFLPYVENAFKLSNIGHCNDCFYP